MPGGVRVRLLLDSAYPRTPPEVHFMQTLHHFFLDNDNGLPPIFYELLSDSGDDASAAGRHTLRATLLLLRILLQAPLHPCEGCQSQFDAFAKMHQERLQTIAQYSLLRRALWPTRAAAARRPSSSTQRSRRLTPMRRRRSARSSRRRWRRRVGAAQEREIVPGRHVSKVRSRRHVLDPDTRAWKMESTLKCVKFCCYLNVVSAHAHRECTCTP